MLRNFLKQYINTESMELKKLSAGQFMEIWENYDTDGKGVKKTKIQTAKKGVGKTKNLRKLLYDSDSRIF